MLLLAPAPSSPQASSPVPARSLAVSAEPKLSEWLRFDSIADGLAAIRNGESIVVVDDENRENEGEDRKSTRLNSSHSSVSRMPSSA